MTTRRISILLGSFLVVGAAFYFGLWQPLDSVQVTPASASTDPTGLDFYDLVTVSLEGEVVELSQYRGQVSLVVNVASKCGLAPQYAGLQKLYEELGPKGFTVLGFPSNDFMGQEPGSPAEIRAFCSRNYGVTFPMFEKRTVSGDDKDEVFVFLSRELDEPSWNFTKYLLNTEGQVVARFGPRTTPDDPRLRHAIEEELGRRGSS